ncbi:MAG: MTAP family purine nucleoside phosphorylase [Candidatus Pacebacteria bacterium]|nr:MTAP family purine nucleoside phosphorylase [Candidatus Paceibacterota bacterium]
MRDINCAIIGGSGLYELDNFNIVKKIPMNTPYGSPSDEITIYEDGGKKFAFIPRHNKDHTIPPHKIPYKANIYALNKLGVKNIYSTCIAGSLKKSILPGSFVIIDQIVDFTWGRDDYFEVDKNFKHIAFASPFCSHLKDQVIKACKKQGVKSKNKGTAVIIQGPRFSTLAESLFYMSNGWDIINMTQYPEAYFAREFGMCYSTLAMITDYNPGVLEKFQMKRKNADSIKKILNNSIDSCKSILHLLVQDDQNHKCTECYFESYLEKL